jgi:peptide/nickel transport system substrate-binding protein
MKEDCMKGLKRGSFIAVTSLFIALFALVICAPQIWAAELKKVPSKSAPTAKAPAPRYGGTLRIADMTDGSMIGYPPKLLRVYAARQVAPAVETLFRTDQEGKPVPWLVTGSKEDAKAKTITLILKKGIKFHDGTDFNAEAVKWNLDQCMTEKTAGTEKFKSIDVIDAFTVRISLTEWDNTVLTNLAQTIGMIVSPTACKKNGTDWCASHPVGTGPFQFVSWEKDVRTVYKKFDGYWQKGKPYLDGIVWTPIADPLTRLFSFRKGEVDLALTVPGKDIPGLEKDGFVITRRKPGSGIGSLVPDSANPNSPFAKLKVRQALQYAIDNNTIAMKVWNAEGEPATQWAYKGHWAYNPNVVSYPYNPAIAKKLLAEAGYPNGFSTKITYRANPDTDRVYTAVQAYLKEIGIDAQLEPVQTARLAQITSEGGKWEGMVPGPVSPNPDVAAMLAARLNGGGMFYSQMLLPEDYSAAINKAITAPNFKEKQKWTREVMKLMIDKYCLQITLHCSTDLSASKPSLHNHGFLGTPNTGWWTPEEAWMETP